jgi:penicillin amidase
MEKKRLLGVAVPGAILGIAGYLGTRLGLSLPKTDGRLSLPGLECEVEVIYDRAGIPHVTASTDLDGVRALGFVTAQDRIVQMQMMLRVASGTLSEAIGSMAVEMDRFMRTIGLRKAADIVMPLLSDDSRARLEAYCEGINAYLSRAGVRLPLEFLVLGGRPRPWVPADCLALGLFTTWELDAFWPMDLMREKLFRSLGRERAGQLLPETAEYNNPPVKVEGPGVDAETSEPGEEIDWGFEGEGGGGRWLDFRGPISVFGSNNWSLGGARTTTGKPLLCGDPHIQHNAPGMLYLCHVKSPEGDVIGASFPGIPVFALGHNGYCGWTETSLCPDTQDLFVETFESGDSDRYLFRGEWFEPWVREEEIRVRFGRTRRLKIMMTCHGPVIKRKGNKGLALSWATYVAAVDSLEAITRQNRSRSWEEFVAAMESYSGPAMNQAYADVDGNIGYLAAAKVPRRAKGDGAIPVDGASGEYEWEGFIPFDRMPCVKNPEEGFIVTANSKIVGEGYPELITKSWESPYRNGRISELILSREKWAPEDMALIHGDALTFPGRHFALEVAEAIAKARPAGRELSPAADQAAARLSAWDFQAKADSVPMCIYFYAWDLLRERLLRHRLGSTLYEDYIHSWSAPNLALENLLDSRDPWWLPPGCASYEDAVLDSLEGAVVKLERVFGTGDQSDWLWGRVHHLTCQNLLGLFWPLDRLLNVGPAPRDGEGDTVNASPPESDSLSQLLARGTTGGCPDIPILPDCRSDAAYAGPVLRMVMDFDDLDNSRAVLDVGQSGHRLSRHYKDHFPHWLKVEYLPLPYSRDRVLAEAEGTLRLLP